MRALLDEIQRIPPRRIGDAPLFVTRQGKPYIKENGSANAFDSLWQRFMRKALEKTDLTERFQERDLRAKVASESATLEEASERLAHASTATTKRIYRRKPTKVKPLILGVKKSNKE
jgi:integrase